MHARILGYGRYTGKKDLGKSSIAAYLARNRPSVIAYHFAHAGDRSSNDARRALLSLCYQLCTQFAEEVMMEPLLHRKSLEDDVCVMDVQSLYRALISVRTGVPCEIDRLQSSLSAGLTWCLFCSFGCFTHPNSYRHRPCGFLRSAVLLSQTLVSRSAFAQLLPGPHPPSLSLMGVRL